MRYLSLFSGIDAASVAWEPLGWQAVAFAEIEPAPCAVLAHRWPHVPNLGDVTQISAQRIAALGPIDIVIGGSPCQDLSVAGKRAGLAGARSSLFHEQMRIFDAARTFCGARWLLWENVPGAFSSNRGRDFAVVVGAMAGLELAVPRDGWGNEGMAVGPGGLVEWCVLDAQWFGVAQRRRRVFAVLDAGSWTDRGPVLLEPDSMRGDSAPSREAREDLAGTIRASAGQRGGIQDQDSDEGLIPALARCDTAGEGSRQDWETCTIIPDVAHSLRAEGFDASEDGTGRGTPLVPVAHPPTIAFDCKAGGDTSFSIGPVAGTLRGEGFGGGHAATLASMRVRRLTPRECERLQGFPDDHTLVPYRGKPMADGPRYKALGNSMAVPVIRWIGERIAAAHDCALTPPVA